MMYPRLKLARNLLSNDGIVFISIDDNEVDNLKKICDEIYGEENFINIISVNMKNIAGASGGGEDKRFKKNCEYLLIYAKGYYIFPKFDSLYQYTEISELVQKYRDEEVSWKYTSALVYEGEKEFVGSTVDGDGNDISIYVRKKYEIKSIGQIMRDEKITEKEAYYKYGKTIFQTALPQSSIRPRVMEKLNELGIKCELISIEYVPRSGRNKGKLYEQFYKGENCRLFAWLKDVSEEIDGVLYKKDLQGTYWDFVAGTKNLSKEGDVEFKNGKKPVDLIKQIIKLYPDRDISILDFFSGSATTAHAIMQLNAEDGGKRKFIMVQLPEQTDEKSEAYKNICEIGKDRIRKAGDKIKEENKDKNEIENLDIGFKVLKLDSSNINKWEYSYEQNLESTLLSSIENIKKGRNEEDILYEILLKYGIDLNMPIEQHLINGKKVFDIGFGAIITCLDDNITLDVVEEIGKLKEELQPDTCRVVFMDNGFNSDSVKTNTVQILKRYNIEDVKCI